MNVDAQLPRRLARLLAEAGHDALHTLDLPSGNRSPDRDLIRLDEADNRVLVTKDADIVSRPALKGEACARPVVDEHLLRGAPRRLLLVATGNIGNADLEALLLRNLEQIIDLLNESAFLELGRCEVRIHE